MREHVHRPTTFYELRTLVNRETAEQGPNCDLNHIDTSRITNLSYLFCEHPFVGDISTWDVSNVQTAEHTFHSSPFNGDISNWQLPRLMHADKMFLYSQFSGDLSRWTLPSLGKHERPVPSGFKGQLPNWADIRNANFFFYREYIEDRASLRSRITEWDGKDGLRASIALALYVDNAEDRDTFYANSSPAWKDFYAEITDVFKLLEGLGIHLQSNQAIHTVENQLRTRADRSQAVYIDLDI